MERKYSADDVLKFFEIAGIFLPSDEVDLFKSKFDELYLSSQRYQNFVGTLWDIYSNILPFKPDSKRGEQGDYFEHLSRDEIFRDKVIKAGLSDKLDSGISLEELASGK